MWKPGGKLWKSWEEGGAACKANKNANLARGLFSLDKLRAMSSSELKIVRDKNDSSSTLIALQRMDEEGGRR